MVPLLASLLRFFLNVFSSRKTILDRFFFVVLNRAADIKHRLTLVKPDTVLAWQRTRIRGCWKFEHRASQERS
jgi:hypothetical protein